MCVLANNTRVVPYFYRRVWPPGVRGTYVFTIYVILGNTNLRNTVIAVSGSNPEGSSNSFNKCSSPKKCVGRSKIFFSLFADLGADFALLYKLCLSTLTGVRSGTMVMVKRSGQFIRSQSPPGTYTLRRKKFYLKPFCPLRRTLPVLGFYQFEEPNKVLYWTFCDPFWFFREPFSVLWGFSPEDNFRTPLEPFFLRVYSPSFIHLHEVSGTLRDNFLYFTVQTRTIGSGGTFSSTTQGLPFWYNKEVFVSSGLCSHCSVQWVQMFGLVTMI